VGIEPTTSRSRTVRAAAALHPAWWKERESNPQGSSLIRFRDGCHRPLACPSEVAVVGRVGIEPTSYGLRDRCNASICYRPVAPPLGIEPRPSAFRADAQTSYASSGKDGVSGDTPRPQLCSCQRGESKLLVPDPGVEPGCHGSEPCVLPLDQSGSRDCAQVSRSSGAHRSRVGPQGVEPRGSLWTTRLQRAPASLPV
jgi:hypothetical protein